MIARLSGPDFGPKSKFTQSNWEEKVISASSNNMKVEFKSADDIQLTVYDRELTGFSAAIRFILLNNTKLPAFFEPVLFHQAFSFLQSGVFVGSFFGALYLGFPVTLSVWVWLCVCGRV